MSTPTTPADRASRELAAAMAQSRPRRAEDGADSTIPVAATVVLARDGERGPEVLLIERPARGSFAGAWVFPGGKLDEGDRSAADDTELAPARRAAVRETREETALEVQAGDLVPMSVWDPPPGVALRIRTWFFAVAAPAGEISLSVDEAVAAQWMPPAEALARHGRGELALYPPTWVTLHELQDHPDVASLVATVRLGGIARFETVARRAASGSLLLWQGDDEYAAEIESVGDPATATVDSGSRHRLEIGALPWRYTRTLTEP